jgi:hypothetical protein
VAKLTSTIAVAAGLIMMSGIAAAVPVPSTCPTAVNCFVPVAGPEIDPGSAAAGLALLLGGLAVLRGRRAQG